MGLRRETERDEKQKRRFKLRGLQKEKYSNWEVCKFTLINCDEGIRSNHLCVLQEWHSQSRILTSLIQDSISTSVLKIGSRRLESIYDTGDY